MKYQNNPFNIRRGRSRWLGSISTSSDAFEKFDTLDHGVRAFFLILKTYRLKYHCSTIRSIISRYAPPCENDTSTYIYYLCYYTGFSSDTPLNSEAAYISLAMGMALFETNTQFRLCDLHDVWKYYHLSSKFRF